MHTVMFQVFDPEAWLLFRQPRSDLVSVFVMVNDSSVTRLHSFPQRCEMVVKRFTFRWRCGKVNNLCVAEGSGYRYISEHKGIEEIFINDLKKANLTNVKEETRRFVAEV